MEKQADPVEVDDTEQTKEHAKSPEPQEIPTLRASLGEKALVTSEFYFDTSKFIAIKIRDKIIH